MTKKNIPEQPIEAPSPEKQPEVQPPIDPQEPVLPVEDPDSIPPENPVVTPPYEVPSPQEGL